jgi:hypothetical protein
MVEFQGWTSMVDFHSLGKADGILVASRGVSSLPCEFIHVFVLYRAPSANIFLGYERILSTWIMFVGLE